MNYLCFLEAGAKTEPENYQRGQLDFLETHLNLWLGELSSKIEALEHAEPYLSLSRVLARYVSSDLIFLNKIIDDNKPPEN